MNEVFVEHIVKRKLSASGFILRFLTIDLTLIAGFLFMLSFNILIFTIAILLGYLAYLTWAYTSVEYEYSLVNSDVTIDKIMGRRKRKNVDSYDIKNAEIIAPTFSEDIMTKITGVKTVDYSSGHKSDDLYSIIISDDNVRMQVVIEPSEKFVDAMRHVRPGIVKNN